MHDWDGKYVVVEEALAAQHPQSWVASAITDTLQAARAVVYVDAEPRQAPRSAFAGEDLGATLVLRASEGTRVPRRGKIYLLKVVAGAEEPRAQIPNEPDPSRLLDRLLLQQAGVATTDKEDYTRLNVLGMLGSQAMAMGDIAVADQHFAELVEIARRIDHPASLVKGYGSLAIVKSHMGREDEAVALFNEALTVARQSGMHEEEGITLSNLAEAYARAGNAEQAIATHMERRQLASRIGDRRGFALSTGNVGITYFEAKRTDDAITFLKVAVHEFRTLGMTPELARALAYLGVAYQAKGDLENAIQIYTLHIRFCNHVGEFSTAGCSYVNLCEVLFREGQREEAVRLATEGSQHLRDIGPAEAAHLQKRLRDWNEA
jgi:tetratricopeptide (TPR) repeat protein